MNRKAIYGALFDLVSAAPGLVTTSRKLKHWTDVPTDAMPALFQAQGEQQAMVQTGQPTRWLLEASLWLYVATTDQNNPGISVNDILDALTGMLDLDPARGPQTLGGLVHFARIEGAIVTSEGTLGDKEVLKIPVRMLAAH